MTTIDLRPELIERINTVAIDVDGERVHLQFVLAQPVPSPPFDVRAVAITVQVPRDGEVERATCHLTHGSLEDEAFVVRAVVAAMRSVLDFEPADPFEDTVSCDGD